MHLKSLVLSAAILGSALALAPAAHAGPGWQFRGGASNVARRAGWARSVRPVTVVRPVRLVRPVAYVRPVTIVQAAPRGYWQDVPVTQQVFTPGPVVTDVYGQPLFDAYGNVVRYPGSTRTVVVGTRRVWVNV